MSDFIEKMKRSRSDVKKEYDEVNSHPIAKFLIQTVVMIVDIMIVLVLMWNMFTLFIPYGSWINFVDGKSMYPTMDSGQVIFSDTSATTIERGDIVTTYASDYAKQKDPKYEEALLVKRVIGIPGDRLVIQADGVYINGILYDEPYLTDEAKATTYEDGKINSVLLDDGEYFVMGDNRSASFDSRSFGIITRDDILYRQSETPTAGFWLKTTLVILMLALDVFLYFLVEFIMTELAYAIFFSKKKTNEGNTPETLHQTHETVILKGDKK